MKVLLALLAVGASAQNGLQAMADAADDNSPIPAGLKSQIQGELGGALQAGGIPDSGDACLQVSGEQCPNGWAARGDGRCCATRGAFLSLKAGGPTLNLHVTEPQLTGSQAMMLDEQVAALKKMSETMKTQRDLVGQQLAAQQTQIEMLTRIANTRASFLSGADQTSWQAAEATPVHIKFQQR